MSRGKTRVGLGVAKTLLNLRRFYVFDPGKFSPSIRDTWHGFSFGMKEGKYVSLQRESPTLNVLPEAQVV